MKSLHNLLLLLTIIGLFSFGTSINDVVAAMKKGDAAGLSRYFDDVVQITMDDKSHAYSRGQAEMILKNFFASRTVKGFTVEHQGSSGETEFCTGLLLTEQQPFRISIFMKMRGERNVIQELWVERKAR